MWAENWQQMKSGDDCPMCKDMHLPENPHSFFVSELPHSFVRLPRNQYLRGWTVVIFKRHACQLFELDDQELSGYWRDVTQVAAALSRIYQPVKINYGVFGNLCPHIHCHLIMQYPESDPRKPINMHEQTVLLNSSDYRAKIEQLRIALR
jgi:diadenosine tetraphosphate (Ap4A) HIT family hydrolase